jgi:hypothetical protein
MLRATLAVAVLVVTIACDSASMPTTRAASPSIAVTVTSSELEVPREQVELLVASVTRGGGYTGDAQLVIDSIPAGFRAEVSGYITTSGMTSALLAVEVDSTVALGIYTLAVRAVAFGLPDVVTPLSVVVESASTPVYTLETRPIAVMRGTSGMAFANIDRGANTLNVPVTISAEGLPAGVTVSLYPVTNSEALSNMTITVGSGVAPGQYSIRIRGATSLLADRVATIPLQVLPN